MRTAALLLLAATACARADLRPRPAPRQIVRAGGVVAPGDPWPAAFLQLQDRLGPPTRAQRGRFAWAALVGDDCYLLEVFVTDDIVTMVEDPYRPAPPWPEPFEHCAEAAR